MRISDWSSDVCSSDLADMTIEIPAQIMDDLDEGRRGLAAWIILGNTRWRIDGTARHRGGSRSFRNDGGRAGQQHCGGRDDGATPQYFLHWPRFWSRLCTTHRSEAHTSELQSLMRI